MADRSSRKWRRLSWEALLRCLRRDVILRIFLCWLRLRAEVAHFLVSAVVQFVMAFKGNELLSGAVLPMKRWPFRGSMSKTV